MQELDLVNLPGGEGGTVPYSIRYSVLYEYLTGKHLRSTPLQIGTFQSILHTGTPQTAIQYSPLLQVLRKSTRSRVCG